MTHKNWSMTITERHLFGDFEPAAKPAGSPLFSMPNIPKPIEHPEVLVVIQRDRDGTRETVRRLLNSAIPQLVREGESLWIEPVDTVIANPVVIRPERAPDFTLETHDRITHVFAVPPQGAEPPIDDMLDRVARVLARTDRMGMPFGRLAANVAAATGTELPGIDAHLLLFPDGSSVRYPGMNDQDFLEAIAVAVGNVNQMPEEEAAGGGAMAWLTRWLKRKRR